MAGVVPAIPQFQFVSATGVPLANGTVYTYSSGTNTPATTYQDQELSEENENPIPLDAAGRAVIWLDSEIVYRFVVKDALGNTIYTQDNISGVVSSGVSYSPPVREMHVATAGQTLFTLSSLTYTVGSGNLLVFVNGLKLIVGDDYNETSESSVTLTVDVDDGDEVEFISGGRFTLAAGTEPTAYTYPAAGAVETTVEAAITAQAALPEYWGAVGDGITDDTAAFQLAINWLQSSGAENMVLHLSAKAYRIAGTLRITGAIEIVGEGFVAIEYGRPITRPTKGTWLIHASTTGALFKLSGAASKGAKLRNFAIFQEGHPTPGPGWAPTVRDWVIRAEGMEGSLYLDTVHFHNVYYGVLCDDSYRPYFDNITGQFFKRAIHFDKIYDTGHLGRLHAWTFWSEDTNVLQWTQANGQGVAFGRADGMDIGSIFTFGLLHAVYFGPPTTGATGSAKVVNINRIYSDFCGSALVVDNGVTHVTVNQLFNLGQAWPVSPVDAFANAGIHIASGSNSLVQVGQAYLVLAEASLVSVQGTANQLWLGSLSAEQYDFGNTGAKPIYVESTNSVYVASVIHAVNYLGATSILSSGTGTTTEPMPQRFGASAINRLAATANTTGNLAVLSVEGDADAGMSLQAGTTGIVQLGSTTNALSFYGGASAVKASVTGSRGGNAALANLLTYLAARGLLTDGTTA